MAAAAAAAVAMAAVIRFTLERAGLNVTVAATGQAGWDALGKSHVDLLVTDSSAPESTLQPLRQIVPRMHIAGMDLRRSGTIIGAMERPRTVALLHPNICSAASLNSIIRPLESITTKASRDALTIDVKRS